MTKPRLPLVTPSTVFGPVTRGNPPQRRPNAASRDREYLKKEEVEKLIAAAGKSRYGLRDQTLVLIAYRHGLRVSELVSLRWDSIDFRQGQIHIARVKGSAASVHPLTGRELRTLRKLQREQDPALPFVFTSERGAPFATGGFRTLIARLGEAAGLTFRAAAWLWLSAGEPGCRYPQPAGLSRSQEHPTHGALYRAGTDAI